MAGIYIHIPFCRQACHYCNFHFSTSFNNKDTLLSCIIKEIGLRQHELLDVPLESIYIGGGTPSLLDSNEVDQIMSSIKEYCTITDATEVTLETNPEDVTKEKLDCWHQLGINRLSIGIQSFHDKDLTYMNRAHQAHQSHEALSLIKDSAIKSVSADLMFGLINSDLHMWQSNLQSIIQYDLDHLSIYNLTIEEQTVFSHWRLKNKLTEPPSGLQLEQYNLAHTLLSSHGYEHYEISNYARNGQQAIHNTNYWNRKPYIGIGPSAHSYVNHCRSWNIANNAKYIHQLNTDTFSPTEEVINPIEQYNELIMLGLRTKIGVSKNDMSAQPIFLKKHFDRELKIKMDQGMIKESNDAYVITENHWYISDFISSELFYV